MRFPAMLLVCLSAVMAAGVSFCNSALGVDALVLVEDGQARAAIVVSSPSPSEQWAAEELQKCVEQMSGAKLPIEQPPGPSDKPVVWICSAEQVATIKAKDLGSDGFVIQTAGSKVLIAGGRQRGTMYGVFTLLERLGVRWWTPTETFVPQMKTVKLPPLDIREVPRLEYRDMMYQEVFSTAGRQWMAHNKANGMAWEDPDPTKTEQVKEWQQIGGRYRFVGNLVHSYAGLLADSGVELKPEMMGLYDGKRASTGKDALGWSQPCLTNPDTLKAMVISVKKYLRENPDAGFIVVGQNDVKDFCQCDACQAIVKREGGDSGVVIDFANRVADEVVKEFPNAKITTAAYEHSRKAPATIRPRDNVYITLSSIECDFAHPLPTATTDVNVKFRADIEAWGKISKKLFIWDYVTNFGQFLMPHPNLDVLTANVKFFADNHAAGVFEQGSHTAWSSEFCELRMWVLAKSLWNPEADGKALTSEFLRGYYGPAAGAVQNYIDLMHRTGRENPNLRMGITAPLAMPYLAPAVIAEAEVALRAADQVAAESKDAALQRRVRKAHMPIWYVLAKRGPGSKTWAAAEARAGKIDLVKLAADLALVVMENKINRVEDGEPAAPWVNWLQDYAQLSAQKKGQLLPPELQGKDPRKFHLVQACQMDSRSRWWVKSEGASDGWAVTILNSGWTITYAFSQNEDFEPGKKYKLFVRAKTMSQEKPEAKSDVAFWCGVQHEHRDVKVSEVADGKYHAFQVCEFTPQQGDVMWFATRTDPSPTGGAYLDCLWLEESLEGAAPAAGK